MPGRRFILSTLTALLIAAPAWPDQPGFNGTWVIDKKASTASFPIPDKLTQKIHQKSNEVEIQTTWREPKDGISPLPLLGVMVTEMKLKTDGNEQRDQVGPFAQASKTTVDGDAMQTEYTAVVHGQSVNGHWKRTLSADGRRMMLEITQTGSGQNAQGTLVFRRK